MCRQTPWLILLSLALVLFACQEQNLSPAPAVSEQKLETDPDVYVEQAELAIAETEAQVLENPHYTQAKAQVTLLAGSVDGLAAAIAQAGPWGKVIVESGLHIESTTVTITHPIRIIGKKGAVIQSGLVYQAPAVFPASFAPVLFVKGANFVQIQNINFVANPTTGVGAIGISVLDSDHAYLKGNSFTNFGSALWIQGSDHLLARDNSGEGLYTEDPNFGTGVGVFLSTGKQAKFFRNNFKDFGTTFFVCDKNGLLLRNDIQGGEFGYLFCKWPSGIFAFPDATSFEADEAAKKWLVIGNKADNFDISNYFITDGANQNLLLNNQSSHPGLYDFEFSGEIDDPFLGLRPASFSNVYIQGSFSNQVIKDCGINNTLIGGAPVDPNLDPCL